MLYSAKHGENASHKQVVLHFLWLEDVHGESVFGQSAVADIQELE